MKRCIAALVGLILLVSLSAGAQDSFKSRPSPLALTSMKWKDAYVKVTYSQPQKRGREVFGQLVPYGQVWRFGANEATEITLTKDLLINNVLLKAGTYSMFAIPDQDKWTIIINSDVGVWGSYNYTAKLDVLRFDIPVQTNTDSIEAFTLTFDKNNDLANLLISWDKIKLAIPFKFTN